MTVKRLLDEATPLPWEGDGNGVLWPPRGHSGTRATDIGHIHSDNDVPLIVYAVNRLPDYEAALDALERVVTSCEMFATSGDSPHIDMHPNDVSLQQARAALRRLREGVPA